MSVVKDVEISHQGLVFRLQIKLIAVGQQPPPPPPDQTIQELKITNVVTSGDDGNAGSNMLVNDANRWSCKGTNCTATFDLGGVQQVGEIFLRFFKDAERTEKFELSLSDDGQNFLGKVTGEQQEQGGVVLSITPFFNARYVRFTGQGNNLNDWNSIEYVKISGKKLVEPEEPCPPGQHRDASGNCVPDEPGPTPEPGDNIIEDGVKMLYPKIGDAKKFTYGSSNAGRAQWSSDNGKCMVNQEVTAILHLKKITNMGEEVSLKLRGGRHTDSAPKEGSCYIIGVTYDGNANKQYESPHPSNHSYPGHEKAGNFAVGSLQGKKIGVKAIVYHEGDHDHIECWLDTDPVKADGTFNNNWRKFWEHNAKEFTGKCNGNRTLIRCDDIEGAPKNPQAELLYGSTREISVGPTTLNNAAATKKDTSKKSK